MGDKYSNLNQLSVLGFTTNAFDKGGDGDFEATVPRSDAEDLSRGARFVPGQVTIARRKGQKVNFHCECSPCCWYWEMPDKSRIYHFERITYERIGRTNHRIEEEGGFGIHFKDGAGPCPDCGNLNTHGGLVKPE